MKVGDLVKKNSRTLPMSGFIPSDHTGLGIVIDAVWNRDRTGETQDTILVHWGAEYGMFWTLPMEVDVVSEAR
jgi:hypothetical protein